MVKRIAPRFPKGPAANAPGKNRTCARGLGNCDSFR